MSPGRLSQLLTREEWRSMLWTGAVFVGILVFFLGAFLASKL